MEYNPFLNIENPELMSYEYAWVHFIKQGIIPADILPNEIVMSWKRCKRIGIDALFSEHETVEIDRERFISAAKENQELIDASRHVMQEMVLLFSEESARMWLASREKVLLANFNKDNKSTNDYTMMLGRSNKEEDIGTNSVDLAIRHKKPICVLGAQHYCQKYHKQACYAAPIIGAGNEVIGAIELEVTCEEMNKYMLAMVAVAARTIEDELTLARNNAVIFKHNKEKQNILDVITDGVIYVNDEQIITQANKRMMRLTGLDREELIGQHISVIDTVPSMGSVENTIDYSKRDIEIQLRGREKSYRCSLKKSRIEDKNNIWIFSYIDELLELTERFNTANRAFFTFDDIIGKSKEIKRVISMAKRAAAYDTRVLIEGESGTGKEVIAQSIHNASRRKNEPFIAVDCGAIPRELLESEMFGYEEGAYTGARAGGSRGKFEAANGGTLFLDEIGNLPLEMQMKMLRILQENKIVKIGGTTPIPVDVRIIAASNVDLKEEVKKGGFREDFLYRFDVMHIDIPPLRERKMDIPLIVENYIKINGARLDNRTRKIDDEVLEILMEYEWPGNVRQLNNMIERMMILSDREVIDKKVIPTEILEAVQKNAYDEADIRSIEPLDLVNRRYIRKAVAYTGGNIKKASELLGISRVTVYKFLKDEH